MPEIPKEIEEGFEDSFDDIDYEVNKQSKEDADKQQKDIFAGT